MLDELFQKWWIGHAFWLTLAFGVIGLAALMTPTPEVVSLFGWDVPTVCGSRLIFGVDCMGCGLTRSFSFMAHGQVGSAWEMNWMGPVMFSLLAAQVPFRFVRIARELRARGRVEPSQA